MTTEVSFVKLLDVTIIIGVFALFVYLSRRFGTTPKTPMSGSMNVPPPKEPKSGDTKPE